MSNEDPNHNSEDQSADERTRRLLQLLQIGAAEVDHTALRDIRERARTIAVNSVSNNDPQLISGATSRAPATHHRTSRAIATLMSAIALLLLAIFVKPGQATEAKSLGHILQQLRSAKSVSMTLKESDVVTHIRLWAPGTVRWTEDDGTYRIADGHRLWQVSTEPGSSVPTVAVDTSPIPPEGTDALRLAGLASLEERQLFRVFPSGESRFDGIDCQKYEAQVQFRDHDARLVAFAEKTTKRLVAMRVIDRSRRELVKAEVRFQEADDEKPADPFDVHGALQNDGRVGVLAEVHGMVFVRSFPGHRWTPASATMPLFAGDQIRCEGRGPNAAVIRLANGATVTAGPNSQVGLRPDQKLQLQNGDIQLKPGPGNRQQIVVGPDGQEIRTSEDTVLRAISAPPQTDVLEIDPPWLQTLESHLTTETLGSLVAQVDGRDMSLSMGFHHVSVEIRDQIARTVVEESFVNNTDERLEGVFHFPLPHDASISGFGMWIGEQLVEADVVEKQRAREIYETILREKRDPGLLEWAGGNLFKARVFPIEAHSEKRIRITYTQTLPLQNGTFRYSYPLRSEMLQRTPLRDLTIDVSVHSAMTLEAMTCPSHAQAEIQTTKHAARLHYAARDITPDRDFELQATLEGRQQDVVVIPHVRGDDGYMMVQLSPPSISGGNWSRSLVGDGPGMDLIILCDTSRSMNKFAREQQSELLAAILGSLSETDRVRLACCDIDCQWLQPEPTPVSAELRESLLESLEDRRSLGWSSLPTTFQEVLKLASPSTNVVYIGDGTVVNDHSEAGARFMAWLEQKESSPTPLPAFHGVAVGNTFDMNVIRAIGRLGRGTSRSVAGSASPTSVARQLLFEMTRPGLKDVKVQFRNVQVAAVYPERLPNLADGMQHILVGRFQPGQNDADGEIVVTGRRGDEVVRYVARMPLVEAETAPTQGGHKTKKDDSDQNSFIPRQWAKAHLDSLLKEAGSPDVVKRIVQISQQYHLITPYTSLLVLESDADRKRFGVDRSMQMRDGEEFFATGREEAAHSIRQQQLAESKLYRQRLYENYRRQIQSLTKSVPSPSLFAPDGSRRLSENVAGKPLARYVDSMESQMRDAWGRTHNWNMSGEPRGTGLQGFWDSLDGDSIQADFSIPGSQGLSSQSIDRQLYLHYGRRQALGFELSSDGHFPGRIQQQADSLFRTEQSRTSNSTWGVNSDVVLYGRPGSGGLYEPNQTRNVDVPILNAIPYVKRPQAGTIVGQQLQTLVGDALPSITDIPVAGRKGLSHATQLVEPPTFGIGGVLPRVVTPELTNIPWPDGVQQLFPAVSHAATMPQEAVDNGSQESDWPTDVTRLLASLPADWNTFAQGIHHQSTVNSIHAISGETVSTARNEFSWAASVGWLRRTGTSNGPQLAWSVDGSSGTFLPAFRTGRWVKHPAPPKRCACPVPIPAADVRRLKDTHAPDWTAKITNDADNRSVILLTHRRAPWTQRRITIDTSLSCVLLDEHLRDGAVISSTTYDQHEQFESLWLPQRITNAAREPITDHLVTTKETILKWTALPVEQLRQQLQKEIETTRAGLIIRDALPTTQDVQAAIHARTLTLEQQLFRVFHLVSQGRWEEAIPLLDSTLQQHGHEVNGHWLRWHILRKSTHAETLRQELPDPSPESLRSWKLWPPATGPDASENAIAIVGMLSHFYDQLLMPDEQITATKTLSALLADLDADTATQMRSLQNLASLLSRQQRQDEALQIRRSIAERWPQHFHAVSQYVETLKREGSPEEVGAAFEDWLADDQPWTADEWSQAYRDGIYWQRSQGEFEAGLHLCQRWTEHCPFSQVALEDLLRCLVEVDRAADVRQLRDSWLEAVLNDNMPPGDALPPIVEARFRAAFNFGFGQLAGLKLAGPEREVRNQILSVAEKFSASRRNIELSDRVLRDHRFVREPDGQRLLKRILTETADNIDTVSDDRLRMLFSWLENSGISGCEAHNAVLSSMRATLDASADSLALPRLEMLLLTWGAAFDEDTPKSQCQLWLDTIVDRWTTADTPEDKIQWAGLIRRIEEKTFDKSHQLKWFRHQYANCHSELRSAAAYELFRALLIQPWDDSREKEAWGLMDVIVTDSAETQEPSVVLARHMQLVRDWISHMLNGRTAHMQRSDEDWKQRNARQQSLLRQQFRVAAVRSFVKVLNEHIEGTAQSEQDDRPLLLRLSSWITLQRLGLQLELSHAETAAGVSDEQRQALKTSVLNDVRQLLPETPVATPDPNDRRRTEQQRNQDSLQLQARRWLFAQWLQLAYESDEQYGTDHVRNVLEYVRKGQETDIVAPRAWRAAEFGILVATDRPKVLEAKLKQWLDDDLPTAPWRRHLGHLLAELDRVEEAVQLYESAGRQDLLSARDWKLLATWQHTLDQRSDQRKSLWQEWRRVSTDRKQSRLQRELNKWNQNNTTRSPTVSADVIRRLSELLKTTTSYQSSMNLVKHWYEATHDPLILKAAGSYVTGRDRVGMLQAIRYTQSLVNGIDQEAGLDMIYESLADAEDRISATNRSAEQQEVDQIGLAVFRLQVATHASRILNQPAPHADRALKALTALNRFTWQPGERAAIAERLDHLGILLDHRLRAARFGAAMRLLNQSGKATTERLQIALHYASICRRDIREDTEIELLESELQSYVAESNKWEHPAEDILSQLTNCYVNQNRFLQVERMLQNIADHLNADNIEERLWQTRIAALREGGRTMLGEGSELYAALRDNVWEYVVSPSRNTDFSKAWKRLKQVVNAGGSRDIDAVPTDVDKLASIADKLIRRHSDQATEITNRVFYWLRSYVGHREAVEFLLDRLDQQPLALQWTKPRYTWIQSVDTLYDTAWPKPKNDDRPRRLRGTLKPIRDRIEDALFNGFEASLKARDSARLQYFGSSWCRVYRNGTQRVVDTVKRVAADNSDSEPQLTFLVNFLTEHFEDQDETAIRLLQIGLKNDVAGYANQVRLVDLLIEAERFEEAITLLRKLIASHKADLSLRYTLMTALYRLKDSDSLVQETTDIGTTLVQPNESAISDVVAFADQCRKCELWQQAADLYQVALDRHGWPRVPVLHLAESWRNHAECLVRIGRDNEAVDAVSAAWVVCGQHLEHRNLAKQKLAEILKTTNNLSGVSTHVAKRAQETGMESSFLRRAIGKAFLDLGDAADAESHLVVALELQADDAEARAWLIEAFDRQGKWEAAIATLIDQLEANPRSVSVYKDLHRRFRKQQLTRQTERALTSIVEVAVEESSHHFAAAELREAEDHFPAAIRHWKRAADLKEEDPNALVRLTRAYLKVNNRRAARQTLTRLQKTKWDERFIDVKNHIRQLRQAL